MLVRSNLQTLMGSVVLVSGLLLGQPESTVSINEADMAAMLHTARQELQRVHEQNTHERIGEQDDAPKTSEHLDAQSEELLMDAFVAELLRAEEEQELQAPATQVTQLTMTERMYEWYSWLAIMGLVVTTDCWLQAKADRYGDMNKDLSTLQALTLTPRFSWNIGKMSVNILKTISTPTWQSFKQDTFGPQATNLSARQKAFLCAVIAKAAALKVARGAVNGACSGITTLCDVTKAGVNKVSECVSSHLGASHEKQ